MAVAEQMGISKHMLVVQNKIDLVKANHCVQHYAQLKEFLQDTTARDAPIIPIAAQMKLNVDVLCDMLVNQIPQPQRDLEAPPRMLLIRSFDVNKPGQEVSDLLGGVVGGSLTQGVLRVGQKIEIRPGIVQRDGQVLPLFSTVRSLFSEKHKLQSALPGGLIAVGLDLDPAITKSDRIIGHVLGATNSLPPVFREAVIQFKLNKRIVNSNEDDNPIGVDPETASLFSQSTTSTAPTLAGAVPKIKKGSRILICIGSSRSEALVQAVSVDHGIVDSFVC